MLLCWQPAEHLNIAEVRSYSAKSRVGVGEVSTPGDGGGGGGGRQKKTMGLGARRQRGGRRYRSK